MIKSLESVVLISENAEDLANFYKDKVGLEIKDEAEGEDGSKMFELKAGDGPSVYIMSSKDAKSGGQGSSRVSINIEVDDIEKEEKKGKDAGVKQVKEIHHLEGYGLIATYEDLDGNNFNLVQVRASE